MQMRPPARFGADAVCRASCRTFQSPVAVRHQPSPTDGGRALKQCYNGDMEQEVRLTIRLPADLHRRLTELARRDHRSLNGEMIALLERATAQAEGRPESRRPDE